MEILEVLEAVSIIATDLPSTKEREPFKKDGLIIICSILIILFLIICLVQNFDAFKLIENHREYLFYGVIGSIVFSILSIYILHKINVLVNISIESFLFLFVAMTFLYLNLMIYLKIN